MSSMDRTTSNNPLSGYPVGVWLDLVFVATRPKPPAVAAKPPPPPNWLPPKGQIVRPPPPPKVPPPPNGPPPPLYYTPPPSHAPPRPLTPLLPHVLEVASLRPETPPRPRTPPFPLRPHTPPRPLTPPLMAVPPRPYAAISIAAITRPQEPPPPKRRPLPRIILRSDYDIFKQRMGGRIPWAGSNRLEAWLAAPLRPIHPAVAINGPPGILSLAELTLEGHSCLTSGGTALSS